MARGIFWRFSAKCWAVTVTASTAATYDSKGVAEVGLKMIRTCPDSGMTTSPVVVRPPTVIEILWGPEDRGARARSPVVVVWVRVEPSGPVRVTVAAPVAMMDTKAVPVAPAAEARANTATTAAAPLWRRFMR